LQLLYYYPSIFFARRDDLTLRFTSGGKYWRPATRAGALVTVWVGNLLNEQTTEIKRMLTALIQKLTAES
jgi:hypothetical protein